MKGMDAKTGRSLSGVAHLHQSIGKILTTPLASRIKRRTFGSQLSDLIDAPNNGETRVRLYAAIATALMRWEPRLTLTRVRLSSEAGSARGGSSGGDGTASASAPIIDIEGTSTETGETVAASIPLLQGSSA
ncbi:MAG: GPW/gp25 family protein [Janthinobacterium lividum]